MLGLFTVPWVLLAVAALFAFVNGVNNGGALVGVGAVGGMVPVESIALLGVGLAVAPLLVGSRVAATLTRGLIAGDAAGSATAVALGVVVAMAVVAALNARGLPTSLTLATVGGVLGSGLGAVLPVDWHTVLIVGAAATVGPLLVAALAPLTLGLLTRAAPRPGTRALPRTVFILQAFAYGANDGQRMLAVAVLYGSATASRPGVVALLGGPVVFCLGAALGSRQVGVRLTRRFAADGPLPGAACGLLSAASALVAAAAGAPVSMTQATAAGLIGTQARRGWRQVRWEEVVRLLTAWLVTLPAALVAGALLGRLAVTV